MKAATLARVQAPAESNEKIRCECERSLFKSKAPADSSLRSDELKTRVSRTALGCPAARRFFVDRDDGRWRLGRVIVAPPRFFELLRDSVTSTDGPTFPSMSPNGRSSTSPLMKEAAAVRPQLGSSRVLGPGRRGGRGQPERCMSRNHSCPNFAPPTLIECWDPRFNTHE